MKVVPRKPVTAVSATNSFRESEILKRVEVVNVYILKPRDTGGEKWLPAIKVRDSVDNWTDVFPVLPHITNQPVLPLSPPHSSPSH